MRLERLLDVVVKFPIGACCLGCVDVASTDDVAVGSIEVERACDILKFRNRKELNR